MNKKELLVEKLFMLCSGFFSFPKKPGVVIERLSKEDREITKELTSKDFNHRVKGLF